MMHMCQKINAGYSPQYLFFIAMWLIAVNTELLIQFLNVVVMLILMYCLIHTVLNRKGLYKHFC